MEILAFVLYFVLVLGIGLFFFFKGRGKSDEKSFFLGGRAMGPWVTAMSAEASDMSAWLLMGLPGSILAFGFGQVWIGIGLALGTAANWIITAKRLRKFSKAAGDSITVPQYLSNRFKTKSKLLQIVCAIIFLVFFTVYVASSFVAGVSVFTSVFPQLDSTLALIIFAAIILLYTFLGGFNAVCWTDFFQGMLMLVALLAIPIVIVATKNMDWSALSNTYSYVEGGETVDCTFGTSFLSCGWKDIVSGLAWGLGYFGMPHIIVRFMSIKSAKMVKKSATVAIIWVVLALVATVFVAIFGRMFIEQLGDAGFNLKDGSQKMVFIYLARWLFPGFIAGILMAAIIAGSMSTADSQLLVASSSFTSDIYKPLFRKNASDKEIMWVSRLTVVVVAVIAFFIASSKGSGAQAIMSLVDNAWGGFGSAFGPVIILSLYWKRLTYKGAVAGVIGGALIDVLWMYLTPGTALAGIYEIIPGFIGGMILCIVVSLVDKKPGAEVEELFETALNSDDE